jgi:hypothetical protein
VALWRTLTGSSARTRWSRALAAALLASVLVLALAAAGSALTPAYCTIPTVQNPPWGFHVGEQINGPTGTYAHGHGNINLTAHTVSGTICQVDRVRNTPDRQIILTVEPHLVKAVHGYVMWGKPGNVMVIDVHVKSTTDPMCKVGTAGVVTIFAAYNYVHLDSVKLAFSSACRDHDHVYRGSDVVTNVPPE